MINNNFSFQSPSRLYSERLCGENISKILHKSKKSQTWAPVSNEMEQPWNKRGKEDNAPPPPWQANSLIGMKEIKA
jgi:hypothetical protein